MRNELCRSLLAEARNEDFVFLTGDLGYSALEPLRAAMGERFINAGVAEQNMVCVAAGLARAGLRPWTYSIAPFLQSTKMSQQVFVTSEPIAAQRQGADPTVFLVADSGYNPYTAVVIARAALIGEQRGLVDNVVGALREGWRIYAFFTGGPENPHRGLMGAGLESAEHCADAGSQGRRGAMAEGAVQRCRRHRAEVQRPPKGKNPAGGART